MIPSTEVVGACLVELARDDSAGEVLVDGDRCVPPLQQPADGVLQGLLIHGEDVFAEEVAHLSLDRVDESVGLLDAGRLRSDAHVDLTGMGEHSNRGVVELAMRCPMRSSTLLSPRSPTLSTR